MKILALDVAILPPAEVRQRAVQLSAALGNDPAHNFTLDDEHLPHITLSQEFVRVEELDAVFERIHEALRGQAPLTLHVTGGAKGGHSLWMAIEQTPELTELHERVMEALRGLDRPGGGPGAFFEGDARVGDVVWVTGYRLKSSFGAFTPHITLGHGDEPPAIEPMTFTATTVAACHLGRSCSCRRVLRNWELA